jgi:hypothetical protein
LIDGSTAYLRYFPDRSFCIKDGHADGNGMVPTPSKLGEFIIKYANEFKGMSSARAPNPLLFTDHNYIQENQGGYSIRNDKLRYSEALGRIVPGVHSN